MNEIDAKQKDNEAKSQLPILAKVLLLIILLGEVKQYFDLDDKYFNGEELTSKTLTVVEIPEYIHGGKSGTDRYTLKAREFNCRFWIMEGGLDIVRNDSNLKKKIESIKIGDTLKVDIYKKAEPHLNEEDYRTTIIGLDRNGATLYNSDQVRTKDKENQEYELKLGTIFFFGILLALNWKRIKSIWV